MHLLLTKLHDTATECHFPYGITQCYLLPDTSEQTGWYSIYRPFKDGRLSKPMPRVQRASGPRLLHNSPRPARLEPRPSDCYPSTLTSRLSVNQDIYLLQICLCTFHSLRGYNEMTTTSPLSARLRSFRPLM